MSATGGRTNTTTSSQTTHATRTAAVSGDDSRRAILRVLIAKPGLDGHDVGAKLVCRALSDAGMEVIYTGLRQSPRDIARAALDEGVDVVGLSMLAGAHIPLSRRVLDALNDVGATDTRVVVGGNIPKKDHQRLKDMGVAAVFPTGASFDEIARYFRGEVRS